uniref:Uncharacterized protein n=1 Tax=Glossina austeni TaxID=7395 RepID=A0A1A9V7B2_GLOAU
MVAKMPMKHVVSASATEISLATSLGSSYAPPLMSEESLAVLAELPNALPIIQIDPPSDVPSNECSSCVGSIDDVGTFCIEIQTELKERTPLRTKNFQLTDKIAITSAHMNTICQIN